MSEKNSKLDAYVTKDDLQNALVEFEQRLEKRIVSEGEMRIQQMSGHYSNVLKGYQDLNKKFDQLLDALQPVIDAQKFVVMTHTFFKWLGVPMVAVFGFCYWVWTKL